jgi:hypothetical protein
MNRTYKVVVKNLPGRKFGECDFEKQTITIDPRQGGRCLMDTLIHETLHAVDSEMSEKGVRDAARSVTTMLWKMGYRQVDNGK